MSTALLTGIIYGTIIEVLQELLLADRYFDIKDLGANIIGCFIGGLLFSLIYIKL